MILSWKDEFLSWDEDLYNEPKIFWPLNDLWTPDILLVNSATPTNIFRAVDPTFRGVTTLYSDGYTEFYINTLFHFLCDLDFYRHVFVTLFLFMDAKLKFR